MADKVPKLPQKLDELQSLLDEIGVGWLLKAVVRLTIDKLRFVRIVEKLVECGEAAVDDYYTGWISERAIQPQVLKMVGDLIRKTAEAVDRWAR